ncbi:MAG: neutral/alkaline non-lysosomal ceramidase N-terminal domain-containing protein, partial [Candidatus Saccharimonadales bacterium]
YQGPVISGAVLGSWSDVPLVDDALREKSRWQNRWWHVDLPYRAGLPTVEQLSEERDRRLAEEAAARASGDAPLARDCRARVEVLTRQLVRFGSLPAGSTYPFPVRLWRIGDGIWVAVEAEHYQLLQVELRRRFPQIPVVVATLVNGSLHTYLPPKDVYGAGIYQETIALLAPGCLERLIEEISREIRRLQSV